MSTHLLIIDPQNDFCDEKGSLYVPGAAADMTRLDGFLNWAGNKIDGIHVTMDSHRSVGIERPRFWQRVSDGAEPAPFTCLGVHPDGGRIVEFRAGAPTDIDYTTRDPSHFRLGGGTAFGALGYLRALEFTGKYRHIIWPEHCTIGTWGWSVYPILSNAIRWWEQRRVRTATFTLKGTNPWTEHFSAVQAEVPDIYDRTTDTNTDFLHGFVEADEILVAGEALSHCVASTVRDMVRTCDIADKLVILTDCCSNVSGFEQQGKAFLHEMQACGVRLTTTSEYTP